MQAGVTCVSVSNTSAATSSCRASATTLPISTRKRANDGKRFARLLRCSMSVNMNLMMPYRAARMMMKAAKALK